MKFPTKNDERIYNIYRDICEANDLMDAPEREYPVPLECPGGCGDDRAVVTDEGIVCPNCRETYMEDE